MRGGRRGVLDPWTVIDPRITGRGCNSPITAIGNQAAGDCVPPIQAHRGLRPRPPCGGQALPHDCVAAPPPPCLQLAGGQKAVALTMSDKVVFCRSRQNARQQRASSFKQVKTAESSDSASVTCFSKDKPSGCAARSSRFLALPLFPGRAYRRPSSAVRCPPPARPGGGCNRS